MRRRRSLAVIAEPLATFSGVAPAKLDERHNDARSIFADFSVGQLGI